MQSTSCRKDLEGIQQASSAGRRMTHSSCKDIGRLRRLAVFAGKQSLSLAERRRAPSPLHRFFVTHASRIPKAVPTAAELVSPRCALQISNQPHIGGLIGSYDESLCMFGGLTHAAHLLSRNRSGTTWLFPILQSIIGPACWRKQVVTIACTRYCCHDTAPTLSN